MALTRIRRALISVSDKRGVEELARGLTRHGVQILSTGGTQRLLEALSELQLRCRAAIALPYADTCVECKARAERRR